MEGNTFFKEDEIYQYVEQIKELVSSELWDNLLLDCSKNEILILWFLYRKKEGNMSELAEYIHVPLNTATGIVNRMEKRELIARRRSKMDKRVVTVHLGEKGTQHLQQIISQITFYIQSVLTEFSPDEMGVLMKFMRVLLRVMKEEKKTDEVPKKKIRKITID